MGHKANRQQVQCFDQKLKTETSQLIYSASQFLTDYVLCNVNIDY